MKFPDLDCPNDWTYVGEGNQNLVVRYIGENPIFKFKVLRLFKIKVDSKHEDNPTLFKQQFIEKVIKPLLGDEYVVSMYSVNTSKQFLSQLASQIESKRPNSRLIKKIDVNQPVSFLMSDLTKIWPTLPTLTFELKPKWGFKPNILYVKQPMKSNYCRFCMHSHLRKTELNGYCPLDLYSQDPLRIDKALNVLLQKNPLEKTLRVSINGQKVSLVQQNPDNIYRSLLNLNISQEIQLIKAILKEVLVEDPILLKLKKLQRTLDVIDIENINKLYKSFKDQLKTNLEDINFWNSVINQYMKQEDKKINIDNEIDFKQIIYQYVLSMTFKDCSLMINVSPCGPNQPKVIKLDNYYFQYDIKVIDTDLKSIDKIPYWYELDQSIIKYAVNTNFNKKNC